MGPLVFVFRPWQVCECTFGAQTTGKSAVGQPFVHVPRIRSFYTRSKQAKSIDTHTNYCLEQGRAFKLMRKSETYPTRLMYTAGRHNISGVWGTGSQLTYSLNRGAYRVRNGNRSGSNPSETAGKLRPVLRFRSSCSVLLNDAVNC